jgi:uncharacterized delta-60 repeat protein
LADELAPAAGLRNILVHDYGEIDDSRVLAAVRLALDGFEAYLRAVQRWLGRGCQTGSYNLGFVRYTPEGNLDPAFGSKARVKLASLTSGGSYGGYTAGTDLALQTDGKLVAVASMDLCHGGTCTRVWAVARLKSDGSLDQSFGGRGIVPIDFADVGLLTDVPRAIAVQPDGRVLVGGAALICAPTCAYRFAFARLDASGNRDSTFGVNGLAALDWRGGGEVWDIALQPDGKIVAAGCLAGCFDGPDNQWTVARLHGSGTLDSSSFAGGGSIVTDFGPGPDLAYALALQHDGRIVVAGRTDRGMATARYLMR